MNGVLAYVRLTMQDCFPIAELRKDIPDNTTNHSTQHCKAAMMRFSSAVPSLRSALSQKSRSFATIAPSPVSSAVRNHKIVVIGGGAAGTSISHQLLKAGGFKSEDVAIVDPAQWHHYQPGWTLVGGGLKDKKDLRIDLKSALDPKLKFYNQAASTFTPEQNSLTLEDGSQLSYEHLIVVPGISLDFGSVKGLDQALADPDSLVSTIYDYRYCDKAHRTIKSFKSGHAIFTQPAGVVKCAGAPQKIMWLATDGWKSAGVFAPNAPSDSAISVDFATGLPAMFGVPKYSAALEEIRKQRGVNGLFQHDLVSIDGNTATFAQANNSEPVKKSFDLLHVSPKNKPHNFISSSPLANAAGYVDVHDNTTQHKLFPNVWSAGDASSLPTSKTVAAITAQAPVLVSNLLRSLSNPGESQLEASYDGYTSCPLLTEYGKVMLAEFKYGGVPKETFNAMLGGNYDQAVPRRTFWHLKKDFFPWVYKNYHVKGNWGGPNGFK
jgi:NADPH-dependent 2,4-dienoyl-CoA reductase/sulfur reductase-like enzyme